MRKTTETQIDNHKYSIGHWHVDKQVEMMAKLFKLLGEPLAMFLMGGVEPKAGVASILDKQIDPSIIGKAVAGLASRINEEEVKVLFRQIVTDQVLCDGKQFDYNTHFMGRIGHLMRVTMAVLKHQYSDFLGESPDHSVGGLGNQSSSLSV